jgi:hypothetical protein
MVAHGYAQAHTLCLAGTERLMMRATMCFMAGRPAC